MADISAKQLGLRKSDLPRSITEVISTLTKAGFEAYIVGGGVRDNLLNLRPKDFDAVTDAKPHEIKDIFGKRCRIIGRRFQLAHVYSGKDMIEVATFRAPPKDSTHTTEDGMIVRDNVWGDIKQDFARRDFSINAMYYQPIDGVVKDFCDASTDIKTRTLRLLGHAKTRIEEDPVRLLRALRFKAKLSFNFDQALAEQFNDENWALLDQVSPHRLYDETQKMFKGGYIVTLLPLLYEHKAMEHLFIYPDEQPTSLVLKIAYNTDKRIADNQSINAAFFYAGLLWKNYLYQLDKYKKRDMPFLDAQKKAAKRVIDRQRIRTAIPKFAEQFIQDIWLLQPKLANPRAKNIWQILEHPKFRAGFDFLLLREQCGEVDTPLAEPTNGMGKWWKEFQSLTEKEQKRAVKQFTNESRRGDGRRKRNRTETEIVNEYQACAPKTPQSMPLSDRKTDNQSRQDSREKAQLQQLSLVNTDEGSYCGDTDNDHHQQTQKTTRKPLFQQPDKNSVKSKINDNKTGNNKTNNSENGNNETSNKVNVEKTSKKSSTTYKLEKKGTPLQQALLANKDVPRERRRRS